MERLILSVFSVYDLVAVRSKLLLGKKKKNGSGNNTWEVFPLIVTLHSASRISIQKNSNI